jgi:hypothetical protein
MKSNLRKSFAGVFVFAVVMLLMSMHSSAQTWAYRAGYGTGNSGAESGAAIATDASGNVYITGQMVTGAGGAGTGINFGGGATTGYGQIDGYVASFTSTGVFRWAMSFGSTLNDQGRGIITDGTNVYVAGNHGNATFNISNNGTTYPPSGGNGGIIMSLNAGTGAFNWLTRFDGTGGEITQALCLDASNNLYASGNFNLTVNFGPFSRTASGGAGSDMFVVKLNSSGTVQWASTGGAPGFNDNANGSGVCFMPGTNQILMGGSFSDAAATYGALTIPHNGGNEICLVELNAGTGAFEAAIGVAGATSTGVDDIYSVCYDPSTTDVMVSGGFDSPSLTFGTNPTLTNAGGAGSTEGFFARYTPSTDTWVWSKAASSSTGSADRVRSIRPDGTGALYITGNFDGTLNLATATTPLSITNNRTTGDDIFIARVKASDGNAQLLGHGAGDNTTVISFSSLAIAIGTNGAWITGTYTSNITFSPLAALASTSNAADIILARYNVPAPIVTNPSQTPITCNVGCNGTATVAPTGGVSPYTYSWSPSGGTAATATGLCPGNYTVTITDNIGTQATQNFTIATPSYTLAAATTQNSAFPVSTTNTIIADASCNLIANLLPIAPTPVTGNVNARVWRQASVPTFGGKPYVQRHYEITPATNPSTVTGRVTLYFTQAEFDNYNAHPGSTVNLPTGPAGDKTGLRIEKRNSQTNNNTGTPGSYTGTRSIIDPVDANIVWNAGASRWEVTFDITSGGWSGFFVHTFLTVLPVNLVSFSGLIAGNDIHVKWQTGAEIDNDHFEVERSTDGTNFVSIGQRAGNNGVGIRNYDLIDAGAATLPVSKLFYRLKIVETSGRVAYSNIVVIYLSKKGGFVTNILPNPFGSTLSIGINASKPGKMNMTVVDASGRVVSQQQVVVTRGFSTQPVNDAAKLGAGVYTLLVEFDGETSAHKIVKQ